jgi:hypothetical protein
MRTITDHIINPANDRLTIVVTDQPGAGGANHRYTIGRFNALRNKSRFEGDPEGTCVVLFQNGPIDEAVLNGVTQEALLAIVIDRLRSFQAGPYSCRENALALTHLEDALHWLHHRTRARMARGVEGTAAR